MEVRTRITEQPRIYLRAPFESGGRMHVKIEVNTFERSPAIEPVRVGYAARSSGMVSLPTSSNRQFDALRRAS